MTLKIIIYEIFILKILSTDSENKQNFIDNFNDDSIAMNIVNDLYERNILNDTQKKRFLFALECYKKAKLHHFEKIETKEIYTIEEYKEFRCMDYGSLMDFVIFDALYKLNITDELYESELFQSILNDVCYHGVLVNDIISLPKEVEHDELRNWILIEFSHKGIFEI